MSGSRRKKFNVLGRWGKQNDQNNHDHSTLGVWCAEDRVNFGL